MGYGSRKQNGKAHVPTGVGIPSMEERVKQVGGRLQVESSGKGTTVSVNVPLYA